MTIFFLSYNSSLLYILLTQIPCPCETAVIAFGVRVSPDAFHICSLLPLWSIPRPAKTMLLVFYSVIAALFPLQRSHSCSVTDKEGSYLEDQAHYFQHLTSQFGDYRVGLKVGFEDVIKISVSTDLNAMFLHGVWSLWTPAWSY